MYDGENEETTIYRYQENKVYELLIDRVNLRSKIPLLNEKIYHRKESEPIQC